MNEKQIQHLAEHIENVIADKVDEKIDRIYNKLQDQRAEMTARHVEMQKNMQPVMDAYKTVGMVGNFTKWFVGIILAIGALILMIKGGLR